MNNHILTKKQTIIDEHLNKPYSDFCLELNVDSLLSRYQLFPNEALYIIDCKQAQLEPLSPNFSKIIGIDRPHKNDLSLLYDHCSSSNVEALCQWILITLASVFQESEGFQSESDVFKCLYLTKDERILLKCTTTLMYDSNGIMRYSLGKLIDLTGLITFCHFGYKYEGPNQKRMYQHYQNSVRSSSGLTLRESEILQLIGSGHCSGEIGRKLFISNHTVDTHRRNIIEKLEVKTAYEAFCKSKNLGWL